MNRSSVSAVWRDNPFFVLDVGVQASRIEIERSGQKLLGLLALGHAAAQRYDTPLGPAARDTDSVRKALEALRNPEERVIHEVLAGIAPAVGSPRDEAGTDTWTPIGHPPGWTPE